MFRRTLALETFRTQQYVFFIDDFGSSIQLSPFEPSVSLHLEGCKLLADGLC